LGDRKGSRAVKIKNTAAVILKRCSFGDAASKFRKVTD